MAAAWDILWPANRRLTLSAAFEAMTCNTRSGELRVALRSETDDHGGTAAASTPDAG